MRALRANGLVSEPMSFSLAVDTMSEEKIITSACGASRVPMVVMSARGAAYRAW